MDCTKKPQKNIYITILTLFLILIIPSVYAIETETVSKDAAVVDDSASVFIPQAPTQITASDFKYDRGGSAIVGWQLSSDDDGTDKIIGYEIFRSETELDDFTLVGIVVPGKNSFRDKSTEDGVSYIYGVVTVYTYGSSPMVLSEPVVPDTEIVNWNLLNLFIIGVLIKIHLAA